MRPTFRLGQLSGISIGLHWSIALIAAVLTVSLAGTILPAFAEGYSGTAYLVAALATSALFLGSIVAHELGHSLVAINNGIKVRGVTLFALGGVASLESEPTNPGAAARIALAGPGVSVAVGGVSLAAAAAATGLGLPNLVAASLLWLGLINLSLAVFNMLPALPLDGGRVLQAFLWHRRGDRHGATISAAGAGRFIGWGLVLFGLWELTQGGNGLWTALIGWFVIINAKGEAFQARLAQQQERGVGPFGFPFPFPQAPPTGQHTGHQTGQPPHGPGPWAPPTQGPWAPPTQGPWAPPGPAAGSWPWGPPRAEDRFDVGRPPLHDDVIDVDGYRIDNRR